MKIIKIFITVFVVGLMLNPIGAIAQSGGIIQRNTIKFDKAKYENELRTLFNCNVMGYQVVLMKKGQVVSQVAEGKARNTVDGGDKMTINTPANIGSTAKFFAGTALLRKFQKPNRIGGGMDSWLNEPFYYYLPKIWQDNMHPSIKKITFKDLLQHKSGFIMGDPDANVYFDYLKKGVSSDTSQDFYYGKSKYANANITTVGYVLAAIDNPGVLKTINDIVIKDKLQPGDPKIQGYLGDLFEIQLREGVFKLSKPMIHPSCDAGIDYPAQNVIFAKTYASATDTNKGATYSSKSTNGTNACHAAGGWYISAYELAAYVANFGATENIVTNATRLKMFDDDAGEKRLLWSFTQGDPFLAKNLDWGTTAYMGGDQGGSHATIMTLPAGYYAVGIVNSNITPPSKTGSPGGSYALTANIIKAFDAGLADNF